MFSPSLEIVLTIAYREAVSRRHAYLTLEHLLYALAHDPDGERILARVRRRPAAAAPRPRRVPRRDRSSSCGAASEREPEQTAAFRRVLQTAVLHVQSAQRDEVRRRRHARRHPAAAEDARRAAARGAGHHAARRARTTSRTASRRCRVDRADESAERRAAPARRRRGRGAAPVARSARRLLREPDRARRAGPARSAHRPRRRSCSARSRCSAAAARTTRCSSATPASARRRWPKASRTRLLEDDVPAALEGRRGLLARHRGAARRHALPRRLRGALQGGHRGARASGRKRDSLHRRDPLAPSAPARPPAARWISRR